ncbi:uncharacterized protein ACN427_000332 isoform 2-T2 [Glossina fuscipes fuscipes]
MFSFDNKLHNQCFQHHREYRNCKQCCCLNKGLMLTILGTIWFIITSIATTQAAAVYTNVNFHSNPTFEPICTAQEEHFIESDGKESSLIVEFNRAINSNQLMLCTRILSAPANYGFIIRLILPKIRHNHHNHKQYQEQQQQQKQHKQLINNNNNNNNNNNIGNVNKGNNNGLHNDLEGNTERKYGKGDGVSEMAVLIENVFNSSALSEKANQATTLSTELVGRTCPLSVFSSHDPHTPQWRLDPCQLEDTAPEMEDPVRLFHGRVRIVWEHNNHTLNAKLMVTVLGKGDQCRSENKHQCLKIGDEPILCISKALICDGIRHCPYSNEYDSDEDYEMCWKRSRYDEPIPPAIESDLLEHFALEIFHNLFAFDAPVLERKPDGKSNITKPDGPKEDATGGLNISLADNKGENVANDNSSLEVKGLGILGRRNATRNGLNSDLSKYGPWGYLMLGMLLCGGALLICGLWASASQHAANNERQSALQNANGGATNNINGEQLANANPPPNYEELDPPPPYSVLFPNQKASSSNTLNSSETSATSTMPATTTQLPPSAAPSTTRSTIRVAVN